MVVGVKICGLTDRESVETAAECGAQFLGFVFFLTSPRNVSALKAAGISSGLPPTIKTVAVTVDATDEMLEEITNVMKPHYIQFHGKEDATRIKQVASRFKTRSIKALKIRSADDVAQAGKFAGAVDYLLFDAKAPESGNYLPGGNGLSFDWMLLSGKNFGCPWFLSGGLNGDNVEEAVRMSSARLLDVSSSVESAPGVKSPLLIREFMDKTRQL